MTERAVTSRTLAHYEANAASFWEGTRGHDVSQNHAALLSALDGCRAFCEMARRHSGCEVLEQDFLALSLPAGRFDGVFANAALFHVPSRDLPRVLAELRASLKARGVLFTSNPRGDDTEGWNGDRYGCFWDLARWTAIVAAAGFDEIAHYYRPEGKPARSSRGSPRSGASARKRETHRVMDIISIGYRGSCRGLGQRATFRGALTSVLRIGTPSSTICVRPGRKSDVDGR